MFHLRFNSGDLYFFHFKARCKSSLFVLYSRTHTHQTPPFPSVGCPKELLWRKLFLGKVQIFTVALQRLAQAAD
jgi:hypothetical protein